MTNYKYHPIADTFPLMEGEPFDKLVEDIKANGLRDPIEVLDDKILDGRNRHRACKEAGVEPRFTNAKLNGSAVAYVLSKNLHRRHLDESQRGMAGARALPLFEAEAKERQKKAGKVHGRGQKVSANGREPKSGKATVQVAKAVSSSARSVERASKVLKKGSKELVQAVEKGDIKLSTAENLATLTKAEQLKRYDKATKKFKPPERKPSPIVEAVLSNMDDVLARPWGIEEQYGSVEKMFNSPLWQKEANRLGIGEVIAKVAAITEVYAEFNQECKAYEKRYGENLTSQRVGKSIPKHEVPRDELVSDAIKPLNVIIRQIKKRGKHIKGVREDAISRIETAKAFTRKAKEVL